MSFSDDQFSVVLDKGTVDALFTDSSTEVVNRIDKMISEISRVLRVGGRFICISLAQQHIVGYIVRFFSNALVGVPSYISLYTLLSVKLSFGQLSCLLSHLFIQCINVLHLVEKVAGFGCMITSYL